MQTRNILVGSPVRLYVLDFGLFRVFSGPRDIGICGYLIQTSSNEHVLIDSGFPEKYADDSIAAAKEDMLCDFGEVLSLTDQNLPRSQLGRTGITPGEIDLFLITHTHIDHIGGLFDFPKAPLVIAEAERALPRPLYWSGAQPWDWPERDTLRLADDTMLGPGFEVFQVPGHAPGQLAIMLELPKTGPVLLCSDAISRPAEIEEGFASSPDPDAALQSARRLLALARQRDAFIVYGHSPEQWPTLRKAPNFYD